MYFGKFNIILIMSPDEHYCNDCESKSVFNPTRLRIRSKTEEKRLWGLHQVILSQRTDEIDHRRQELEIDISALII
jgi:hypothetical protein